MTISSCQQPPPQQSESHVISSEEIEAQERNRQDALLEQRRIDAQSRMGHLFRGVHASEEFARTFACMSTIFDHETVGYFCSADRSTETCRIALLNYKSILSGFSDFLGPATLVKGDYGLIQRVDFHDLDDQPYRSMPIWSEIPCESAVGTIGFTSTEADKAEYEKKLRECQEERERKRKVQETVEAERLAQLAIEKEKYPVYHFTTLHRMILTDSIRVDVAHSFPYEEMTVFLRLKMDSSLRYEISCFTLL